MQFLASLPALARRDDDDTSDWLVKLDDRHGIRLARADEPAVQALVRSRYEGRGLRYAGPARADLTLAACEERRVVATMGLRVDGPAGLAADAGFATEVARLRRRHRLAEFTRLACVGLPPASPLLALLWHTAWLAAHRLHAADVVLMEVHPRHARFYRRQLGCRALGGERMHRGVEAPAVLLAADAEEVNQRLQAVNAHPARPQRHSVCARAFRSEEEDRMLCRLLLQAGGGAAPFGGGRQGGWNRPAAVACSLSLEETFVSLPWPRRQRWEAVCPAPAR